MIRLYTRQELDGCFHEGSMLLLSPVAGKVIPNSQAQVVLMRWKEPPTGPCRGAGHRSISEPADLDIPIAAAVQTRSSRSTEASEAPETAQ